MKFTLPSALLVLVGVAVAQSPSQALTSTITITPGCPTPAADVKVTRSAVIVPSCAAGNGTKPVIVSMSGGSGNMGASGTMGGGGNMGAGASATRSGMPAQFTGGATQVKGRLVMMFGGVVAALVV